MISSRGLAIAFSDGLTNCVPWPPLRCARDLTRELAVSCQSLPLHTPHLMAVLVQDHVSHLPLVIGKELHLGIHYL